MFSSSPKSQGTNVSVKILESSLGAKKTRISLSKVSPYKIKLKIDNISHVPLKNKIHLENYSYRTAL